MENVSANLHRNPRPPKNGVIAITCKLSLDYLSGSILLFSPIVDEERKPAKFSICCLMKILKRLKQIPPCIRQNIELFSDLFHWKSPIKSIFFLIGYVFVIFYIQIWWIPMSIIGLLLQGYSNGNCKGAVFRRAAAGTFGQNLV